MIRVVLSCLALAVLGGAGRGVGDGLGLARGVGEEGPTELLPRLRFAGSSLRTFPHTNSRAFAGTAAGISVPEVIAERHVPTAEPAADEEGTHLRGHGNSTPQPSLNLIVKFVWQMGAASSTRCAGTHRRV